MKPRMRGKPTFLPVSQHRESYKAAVMPSLMSPIPRKPYVVVVGAGIVGLTTALEALNSGYEVDVIAEHLPTDAKHPMYTSCWAGAHAVSAARLDNEKQHAYDRETNERLLDLLEQDPKAPICIKPQFEYREDEREDPARDQLAALSTFALNFRYLRDDELRGGATHGATFDAINIDTINYLRYLYRQVKARGGRFIRYRLPSLQDLSALERIPQAVMNCSGLGARTLVNDDSVYPVRGQVLRVHAPWLEAGYMNRSSKGTYTYIIPSRQADGDVIIGGSADHGDWNTEPRDDLTRSIAMKALELCPELLPPSKRSNGTIDDLDIREVGVGLRPARIGGVRVEKEEWILNGLRTACIHNYGHGGSGFESSFGTARAAVDLLRGAVPL